LVLKSLTLSYRKLIKAAQYGTGRTQLLFCHQRGRGTRPRDVDSLLGGASEANLVTRSRPSSPLMTRQKSGIPSTLALSLTFFRIEKSVPHTVLHCQTDGPKLLFVRVALVQLFTTNISMSAQIYVCSNVYSSARTIHNTYEYYKNVWGMHSVNEPERTLCSWTLLTVTPVYRVFTICYSRGQGGVILWQLLTQYHIIIIWGNQDHHMSIVL
jgi:hypothetical protein